MKSKNNQKYNESSGFSLIEAIVGLLIFCILAVGILQIYSTLSRLIKSNRQQTIMINLTSQKLETARNMPYDNIGTVSGVPNGTLPDFTIPETITVEGTSFQIFYEVTYVDDPSDGTIVLGTDPAPNDYKQLKMFVKNTTTLSTSKFVTNVSPRGLEGLSNAGALALKVFNSQGQPVGNATVQIVNPGLGINLNRSTNAAGDLIEVGLPASVNGYQITVTKQFYSTDQTYPITVANPSPTKPHATVTNGAVTAISFAIDILSNLNIYTLRQNCTPLNNVDVNVRGGKLIGTSPDVYKFDANYSSAGGLIDLLNIEWDNYTPTLLVGATDMVYGTSPVQNINILPGTTQSFNLILGPLTANSLLVIVKDAATGIPLENAQVDITDGGSDNFTGFTGGSVFIQNNWIGGSGQTDFLDTARYFVDDGFVDVDELPTGLRLADVGGYVPSGTLYSSTFDTGTASTSYTTLNWQPPSQVGGTELKFQIASNNDNATWNYVGPDGTDSTYYTIPGTDISAVHDGDQYIRYMAVLTSSDTNLTPVLTSVEINYVSGCFTPGQVMFPGLNGGAGYSVDVSLAGYSNYNVGGLNVTGNQVLEVLLSP